MKFGYNRGWETTMYLSHYLHLQTHSRARFLNMFGYFQFYYYLNLMGTAKYKYSLIKLRLPSHSLAAETGRWNKPHPIPR